MYFYPGTTTFQLHLNIIFEKKSILRQKVNLILKLEHLFGYKTCLAKTAMATSELV
jgi:hypothetical protein